ncbi:hypothetical protein [Croceicoccus naphthovorans]|uniref:Uncharacterized protein n=1 Tax=Croceicoccus naphthovorans TaxID=1348774 RepID=A0A0G3XBD6_9SPHN|nr:hypothetical protein [Croceicoccus naphthovorans]AKM08855.1 hypothetical protein AB433_00850 [Croceicoccus naphthovorans]MBB3992295.1 hypothetical protein [Croceicoccus naphthovorans]
MAFETLTIALVALAAVAIVTMAALRGWQGWLALKMQELHRRAAHGNASGIGHDAEAGARIEIADLRERVRQLEAIAAGVDL